ncbi:MAG: rhodanese-like domain-containing protein [Intrasporangium sp.]|uniref:rhodanese-like domain-containing protein n=1 Tax=Intrasporangium sp. TaxID=1925024 RepID=UPI003F7FF091
MQWHELPDRVAARAAVLDVRTPTEYASGHIPGAVNIELDTLRHRLDDLLEGPS